MTPSQKKKPPLIPQVRRMEHRDGVFALDCGSRITWQGSGAEPVAVLLGEYLQPATGFVFPVQPGDGQAAAIHLAITDPEDSDAAGFFSEGFKIEVNTGGLQLSSRSAAGLARGVQVVRQLLPAAIFADTVQEADWSIPFLSIEDEPEFRWRGLHLDVCRHFFGADDVCRFIELLAQHRLNVCHLHLTDDQGWRVEIKQYPRLTQVGSQRKCSLVGHELTRPRRYDDTPYGGFFTQEDIRHIVAFAARRHVTVVPEIEMPGHAQAVIASYPELGCALGAPAPRCHWGISQHVFNVEESTLRFLYNVLDEVMDLFPSRFIHMGGDEAPRFEWSEKAEVQARMVELGIPDEDQLQSWFVGRIASHVHASGRRLIGWDEILEGGLPNGVAVMSWRGEEGGIRAAAMGSDVVMAPTDRVYFDHYQTEQPEHELLAFGGFASTETVYGYEPIPAGMPAEHTTHVLGAQGQLWTEYICTRDHLDSMAFPRACALAEALWLPREHKDWSSFLERLTQHRVRLQIQGVHAFPQP